MRHYKLVKFQNGKFGVRTNKTLLYIPYDVSYVAKDCTLFNPNDLIDLYCTMTLEEAKTLLQKVNIYPIKEYLE